MVWFASNACFSSALKSSSRKTLHHSPLAMPSFGVLSRHGSVTSHLAGTGAVARWYFGPTVQPHATMQAAKPSSAENRIERAIIVFLSPVQRRKRERADLAQLSWQFPSR